MIFVKIGFFLFGLKVVTSYKYPPASQVLCHFQAFWFFIFKT